MTQQDEHLSQGGEAAQDTIAQLRAEVDAAHKRIAQLEADLAHRELPSHDRDDRLFRMLFEMSLDGIAVADGAGRYLQVNDAACTLLGYSRSELLTMSVADLQVPAGDPPAAAQYQEYAASGGERGEFRFRRPDGTECVVEYAARAISDNLHVSVLRDVTGRAKMERALRQREELFRLALEATEEAAWDYDISTGRIDLSSRLATLLDLPQAEPEGVAEHWHQMLHPDDRERVMREIVAHRDGRTSRVNAEYRLQFRSGEYKWVRTRGKIVQYAEDGTPRRAVGTVTDIGTQKRAEDALTRINAAVEGAADAIGIADVRGHTLYFNRAFRTLFGYTPAQLNAAGGPIALYADQKLAARMLGTIRGGGTWSGDIEVVTRDGRRLDVFLRADAIRDASGKLVGIFGIHTDITERKRAEAALRESEERYRRMVETATEGVWSFDAEFRTTFVNLTMAEMLGYTPDEMIGQPVERFLCEEDLDDHAGKIALRRQGHPARYERRMRRKDGAIRWMLISATPLMDHDGVFVGSFAMFGDITNRKEAEEQLRASEERYQTIARATNDIIWDWDPRADAVWWSQSLERVLGHAVPDGRTNLAWWRDKIHPDDQQKVADGVRSVMDDGGRIWTEEYRVVRADGSYAVVVDRGEIVRDEDGHAVRVFGGIVDVTERHALEEQVRQAQKMEAVGQLAGGVAHDFNNILTAILGSAELVRCMVEDEARENDPVIEGLTQIERAAQRASNLTRQLLAFSRRQMINPQVLDPAVVLEDMRKLLRPVVRENIEFVLRCAPELWHIRVDVGQFEQVLMNLVVNACDAMPSGGRLTIEAENVTLCPSDIVGQAEGRPGPHVRVVVSDTGHGIEEAHRARIFEPFFTTKPAGKGTGLGLACVHGVIKQAGGHVSVDSEPGAGTTFGVYLPAVDAPARPTKSHTGSTAQRGGNEQILVCEDDDAVRELTRRTLEGAGYRVVEARHAQEALALVDANDLPIDLLVTDVIMPGMNGRELSEELQARRPDLRVLFVSGYPANVIGQHGVLEPGTQFLEKPYSSRTLLGRIRAILDLSARSG